MRVSATRTRSRSRSGSSGTAPAAGVDAGSERSSVTAVAPRLAARSGRAGGGGRGSFRWQRLALVEVAAALVLVAWVVDPVALAVVAPVALVLLSLALVRRRGRSLPEWLATVWSFRSRTRRARSWTVPPGTEPGLAPAVECAPALRTYRFAPGGNRDRRPVGMVGDGGFLTVVLQVESDTTALRAERERRPLPLSLVRDALVVDGIRLESAQVVVHTQPAPAPHLPQDAIAVTNYARLHVGVTAPAVRLTWVALKLDPELCPEAVAARGGGLVGAQKCVARSAQHLASRLTGAGFRVSVLTDEELTAAVATSAGAHPLVTAQAGRTEVPQRRTEESSRSWRCDNGRHTAYWIRRWPPLGGTGEPLTAVVARLTAVPALATTFSLTLDGGGRDVGVRGHLRVSGRTESELTAARRALEQTAREARVGLARLDREQLPGVLATLPLGGVR
ncbi:type VII secretion protein EccE [Streptomyces sp. NPDC005955]|uniref:type VII secretion protein EccE n=1 Tax=Streptomyces sp. NPDC005955 TaxID=3364738 RepID=UPI0036C80C04